MLTFIDSNGDDIQVEPTGGCIGCAVAYCPEVGPSYAYRTQHGSNWICRLCEYREWKTAVAAMSTAPQG